MINPESKRPSTTVEAAEFSEKSRNKAVERIIRLNKRAEAFVEGSVKIAAGKARDKARDIAKATPGYLSESAVSVTYGSVGLGAIGGWKASKLGWKVAKLPFKGMKWGLDKVSGILDKAGSWDMFGFLSRTKEWGKDWFKLEDDKKK